MVLNDWPTTVSQSIRSAPAQPYDFYFFIAFKISKVMVLTGFPWRTSIEETRQGSFQISESTQRAIQAQIPGKKQALAVLLLCSSLEGMTLVFRNFPRFSMYCSSSTIVAQEIPCQAKWIKYVMVNIGRQLFHMYGPMPLCSKEIISTPTKHWSRWYRLRSHCVPAIGIGTIIW